MLESLIMQSQVSPPTAPTEIGTFWEGGYYTGRINIEDKIYALVVAPKATGQSPTSLVCKTTATSTPGTDSLNDGWNNTQAMIAAGPDLHPAAKYCRNLKINGYEDWYLPSVDELEICYRNLKPRTDTNSISTTGHPYGPNGINPSSIPIGVAYTANSPNQTTVPDFKTSQPQSFIEGWYCTSSQFTEAPASVWLQGFSNGDQYAGSKIGTRYVRAIRKVLIG